MHRAAPYAGHRRQPPPAATRAPYAGTLAKQHNADRARPSPPLCLLPVSQQQQQLLTACAMAAVAVVTCIGAHTPAWSLQGGTTLSVKAPANLRQDEAQGCEHNAPAAAMLAAHSQRAAQPLAL